MTRFIFHVILSLWFATMLTVECQAGSYEEEHEFFCDPIKGLESQGDPKNIPQFVQSQLRYDLSWDEDLPNVSIEEYCAIPYDCGDPFTDAEDGSIEFKACQ